MLVKILNQDPPNTAGLVRATVMVVWGLILYASPAFSTQSAHHPSQTPPSSAEVSELISLLHAQPRTLADLVLLEKDFPNLLAEMVRRQTARTGMPLSYWAGGNPMFGRVHRQLTDGSKFWVKFGRWVKKHPAGAKALAEQHARFQDLNSAK